MTSLETKDSSADPDSVELLAGDFAGQWPGSDDDADEAAASDAAKSDISPADDNADGLTENEVDRLGKAEMVARDLDYLAFILGPRELLALVSRYCGTGWPVGERGNGGRTLDEAILRGKTDKFLAHAALVYKCTPKNWPISQAWAASHRARPQAAPAEPDLKQCEPGVVAIAPEKEFVKAIVRDILRHYPGQTHLAVQIAVRESLDPAIFGAPTEDFFETVSDRIADPAAWAEFRALYEEHGLGLWPGVAQRLAAEGHDRAAILGGDD